MPEYSGRTQWQVEIVLTHKQYIIILKQKLQFTG